MTNPKRGHTKFHPEIIGKKFGHLTVIESVGYIGSLENFKCKCDCGADKIVDYQKLVTGHTSSCGSRLHRIKHDLTNKRFGRLVAIRPCLERKGNGVIWECKCDCGNTAYVPGHNLMVSGIKSCGCWKKEKHERKESRTRLYKIWRNMKSRCLNSNIPEYRNYGGRGIAICEEWMKFHGFKEWAITNGYTEELTLERIDVNGNYCPENCKWITLSEQTLNKRNTLRVLYKGELITLVELSRITNIPYSSLYGYYRNNDLESKLRSRCV